MTYDRQSVPGGPNAITPGVRNIMPRTTGGEPFTRPEPIVDPTTGRPTNRRARRVLAAIQRRKK